MSDRQNLPRPAPELSEHGVPAIAEVPADVVRTGDPLEGELAPLDSLQAVNNWGTTAAEQLASEPLEVRRARGEPDVLVPDEYADRQFREPGAGGGLGDDEADSVGEAGAGVEDTLSAEEAAMRIVEEPPGIDPDPDPGSVDDGSEQGET